MVTTVSEGMDAARVRQVAQSMLGLSNRLGTVKSHGDAQLSTLEHVWSGDDLDAFTEQWHQTSPGIAHTADALRAMGRSLQDQAADQEVTSGAGGAGGAGLPGWPGWPDLPDLKAPRLPGQEVLDLIWKGIKTIGTGIKDFVVGALDVLTSTYTTITLLAVDLFEAIKNTRVGAWASDLVRKWAPKVSAWADEWLPKIGRFGAKFSKVLPIAGVVGFFYDSREILNDIWNGEMSPRDIYDLVTGGIATVAAFFPGVGTLISAVFTLDGLRMDALDWVRREHPDWWLAEAALVVGGYVLLGPLGLLGSFLPDENVDLPGRPPKEVWGDMVETFKDDEKREELLRPKPFAAPIAP